MRPALHMPFVLSVVRGTQPVRMRTPTFIKALKLSVIAAQFIYVS
jgi:hypothetical protein